jgi:hypothetical protein
MKKFTITVISLFMVLLISLSAVGEAMGTSSKYASNQDYIQSENLALRDKSNKMTDGKDSSVYRFKTRNGGESVIDLGESCNFNSVILKEKGLNVQKFSISVSDDNESFTQIYANDKIEFHRLCTFDTVEARYVKLTVEKSDNLPKIREMEIYNATPEKKSNFRVATYGALGDPRYGVVENTIYGIIDNDALSDEEKNVKIKELIDSGYYDTITDYIQIGSVIWDEDGSVKMRYSDDIENKYYAVMMRNLHEVLDEKGVNLVITILNPSGENGNQRVMKSITENRDTLITNMIAFANKYEFDGIDLDWEFPMSQDEFDAYNSFLQELKAKMKTEMWNKEDATLSLALGTWALKYTPEAIECIDYVNVMGYDILDQDGQHSSFFSSCVQAADYIESRGFSKEQINIGFPFYGTWEGGRMEQYAYNAISEEISPFNNFYTMKKSDTKEDRYTYFNSQAIIRDKTAYAYLKGYGGVMIFSQYCDLPSDDERSLTKAISDYLQEVTK